MADRQSRTTPFIEFIDDYFVECDEHMAIARASLLALESGLDSGQLDGEVLDDLFRSFHSIKGLSAMVGVADAEQLAHEMENFLSALHKKQARLSVASLETFIVGVTLLEKVIAARRANASCPDIQPFLQSLALLLPGGTKPSASPSQPRTSSAAETGEFEMSPEKSRVLKAALDAGARAWRVTFVPTPALAERGVNVNSVRQRLQGAGALIHAIPLIRDGQIAFAFLAAANLDEATISAWKDDGLSVAPHEDLAPAEPSARNGATASSLATLMPANVVRVDLGRLDELMRMVGELVISRSRLDDTLKRLGPEVTATDRRALQETNQAIERQLRDLREGVMRVRLVPIREVFARMQFVIRDLTREHGKKVTLSLSGQETEIDKYIVERMMDPLLHLVRNAVSHGLENPDERVAAGKPAEGNITLRASATGDTIAIEVQDDGRGVDAAKVIDRARAAGLIDAETPSTPGALLDILCAPGFSTRDEADRASGRGVGMAVVRTAVEGLGGALTLETQQGKGTHFTIQLPLTLAIADAVIVSVGGQKFAVPQTSVREIIQVDPSSLKTLENNELMPYRTGVLPVVRLAPFFGMPETDTPTSFALVMGQGIAAVAILVERVFGLREIVVRSLTDPLIRVPGIAAATELGDGRVVLILDALALARAARKQSRGEKARQAKRMIATDAVGVAG